jgi:hypothetical protein
LSLFGTGRREGFLAGLLLVVLALVQHAPGLLFARWRTPIDPTRADATAVASEAATNQLVLLPAMQRVGAVLRQGEIPLWNPWARLGEPFAASGAPVLYPPFWLLALDDGRAMLELVLFLHTALACVLAYRMLRTLSASRFSAFVAGGLYGLGWAMTTALDRLPEAAAMALLPWTISATWHCLFDRRRAHAATQLALSLALSFATGGTATAWLGALLAVSGFGAGLLAIDRTERLRSLRATLVGLLLAALVTAPLWLQAAELRAVLDSPTPAPGQVPAVALLALFAPGLFGELGATGGGLRSAAGDADGLALALYPGAMTLFVGLLGLLRPKRTRQTLYWIAIAGLALVLATTGAVGDLARSAVRAWPYRPGAELALFHIAACVLAALALESFFDAPRSRRIALPLTAGIVLTLATATLVAFALLPSLGAGAIAWLLGADPAALDDTLRAQVRLAVLPPSLAGAALALCFLVWRPLGILRFKAAIASVALGEAVVLALIAVPRAPAALDTARVEVATDSRALHVGPGVAAQAASAATTTRMLDADGWAILTRTRRLLDALARDLVELDGRARVTALRVPALLSRPFREALAVGVALGDDAPPGFLPMLAAPGGSGSHATLTHVASPMSSRARLAWHPVHVATPREALAAMSSPARSALGSVVLEGAPRTFETLRPAVEPTLTWVADAANRVALGVAMGDGRAWLVLSDALAPGWRCTVDGEPRPVFAADVAGRAIELREGTHEVVFEYSPLALRLGLPIAAFGLVLLAGAALWSRRRS